MPAAEVAAAFPGLLDASRAFHDTDDQWRSRGGGGAGPRCRAGRKARAAAAAAAGRAAGPGDEDLSPATVLRPRHAVVGYVGREQLLGELADWCEQEAARRPGRAVVRDRRGRVRQDPAGGGGLPGGGGTRLDRRAAAARCQRRQVRALAEWPGRLLIAVDYAETSPALVGRLAEELAARAPRPAARIMLLVRRRASRAELLELFNEQREEQLDALLRRAPISRLEEREARSTGWSCSGRPWRISPRLPGPRDRAARAAAAGRSLRPAAVRAGRRVAGPDVGGRGRGRAGRGWPAARAAGPSTRPTTGTGGTRDAPGPGPRLTSGPRSPSRPCSPPTATKRR